MKLLMLSESRLFFRLLIICLILLFLDIFRLLELPKSLFQVITSPIQYGVYKTALGISHQFEFITYSRKIYQENLALKKQLATVLSENGDLQRELREQKAEVAQESSLDPKTFNLLSAKIIGIGRFVTIDKGSNEGLKVGQAVIFKDNYLGQLKTVGPKTSQVILSTDPDSKVAVFSQDKDGGRARGIVVGQFGTELLMDKILHQEPISEDDLVYSEGSDDGLPRGLILGRVSKIFEQQNQLFKSAKVTPVIRPSDLDLVFIITTT